MPTPREIINYLLPFMITAGRYSVRIQRNIGTHPAKEGGTIFHHALSDADLTIQSFLSDYRDDSQPNGDRRCLVLHASQRQMLCSCKRGGGFRALYR